MSLGTTCREGFRVRCTALARKGYKMKRLSLVFLVSSLRLLAACGAGGGSGGGGVTHFSVNGLANIPSGTPFNLTVTALDAANNPVTSYSGTVHFTSSDPHAQLPPNSTLPSGSKAFSATLTTAGSQMITA